MGDSFSKKLQEMLADKMIQSKVSQAIEMLKKDNTDDLAKKIGKLDKEDIMNKINEFDDEKIKNLKINKDEIKKKVTQNDLDKLGKLLGKDSDAIMKKVNDFLKS
ncbi:MAG TPA: membrane trafficking protein [Ruminiclostridium sp.]